MKELVPTPKLNLASMEPIFMIRRALEIRYLERPQRNMKRKTKSWGTKSSPFGIIKYR